MVYTTFVLKNKNHSKASKSVTECSFLIEHNAQNKFSKIPTREVKNFFGRAQCQKLLCLVQLCQVQVIDGARHEWAVFCEVFASYLAVYAQISYIFSCVQTNRRYEHTLLQIVNIRQITQQFSYLFLVSLHKARIQLAVNINRQFEFHQHQNSIQRKEIENAQFILSLCSYTDHNCNTHQIIISGISQYLTQLQTKPYILQNCGNAVQNKIVLQFRQLSMVYTTFVLKNKSHSKASKSVTECSFLIERNAQNKFSKIPTRGVKNFFSRAQRQKLLCIVQLCQVQVIDGARHEWAVFCEVFASYLAVYAQISYIFSCVQTNRRYEHTLLQIVNIRQITQQLSQLFLVSLHKARIQLAVYINRYFEFHQHKNRIQRKEIENAQYILSLCSYTDHNYNTHYIIISDISQYLTQLQTKPYSLQNCGNAVQNKIVLQFRQLCMVYTTFVLKNKNHSKASKSVTECSFLIERNAQNKFSKIPTRGVKNFFGRAQCQKLLCLVQLCQVQVIDGARHEWAVFCEVFASYLAVYAQISYIFSCVQTNRRYEHTLLQIVNIRQITQQFSYLFLVSLHKARIQLAVNINRYFEFHQHQNSIQRKEIENAQFILSLCSYTDHNCNTHQIIISGISQYLTQLQTKPYILQNCGNAVQNKIVLQFRQLSMVYTTFVLKNKSHSKASKSVTECSFLIERNAQNKFSKIPTRGVKNFFSRAQRQKLLCLVQLCQVQVIDGARHEWAVFCEVFASYLAVYAQISYIFSCVQTNRRYEHTLLQIVNIRQITQQFSYLFLVSLHKARIQLAVNINRYFEFHQHQNSIQRKEIENAQYILSLCSYTDHNCNTHQIIISGISQYLTQLQTKPYILQNCRNAVQNKIVLQFRQLSMVYTTFVLKNKSHSKASKSVTECSFLIERNAQNKFSKIPTRG
ncbi:Hypothetical_protein [Hexamita inflata]|uniref:Hypothetical_protein n=1 Tax=Hexamita inflata TaxID=28002 RepID=A0AA86RAJ1_9EUKA|nr:Hypothetical protein HINF_LOCUS16467 [Hexamita inflata]CAI9974416.1 Hypothetical protein HINF_LOCUS62061 [Hexamita inflata]